MTEPEIRALPALRVAGSTFAIADPAQNERIGQVFDEVWDAFVAAGEPAGLPVAWYAMAEGHMDCWVGYVAASDVPGTETFHLPAIAQAAVVSHRGEPDGLQQVWTSLMEWLEQNSAVPSDCGREVYLETPRGAPSEWVTEVQQPFDRR